MVTTGAPTLDRDKALQMLAAYFGPQMLQVLNLEQDWETWVTSLFPEWVQDKYTHKPISFAPHMRLHWEWIWSIRMGKKPTPLVEIWPRGGAKSTSAELGTAALAARKSRRYGLYICATQEQADDHVQNIGVLLQASKFAQAYPSVAERAVNKYGSSKGWRRNRLRTSSGFTIDAIGLDTAARGIKIEEARPDLMVLDDIDEEIDSPASTDKKILTLTHKLLPAGSTDLAVLAIQNLVINNGVFARLAGSEGADEADFLQNRTVLGPYPAIYNAQVTKQNNKYYLIGGTPSWEGKGLEGSQHDIDEWGYSSWRVEAQQEVTTPPGGLFAGVDFESLHVTPDQVPELIRTVVWVDPATTSTDHSDSHGIQVDGLGVDNLIYRLRSYEGRSTPAASLKRAITWALEYKADHVGVETDQGGDVWEVAYNAVWDEMVRSGEVQIPSASLAAGKYVVSAAYTTTLSTSSLWYRPAFRHEKAGAGYGPKTHRASRQLVDYERGLFRHVLGTHDVLERALGRFPLRKPFDLTDATFWSWNALTQSSMNGVGASVDAPSSPLVSRPPMPMGLAGIVGRSHGRVWRGHRNLGDHSVWRSPQVPSITRDAE